MFLRLSVHLLINNRLYCFDDCFCSLVQVWNENVCNLLKAVCIGHIIIRQDSIYLYFHCWILINVRLESMLGMQSSAVFVRVGSWRLPSSPGSVLRSTASALSVKTGSCYRLTRPRLMLPTLQVPAVKRRSYHSEVCTLSQQYSVVLLNQAGSAVNAIIYLLCFWVCWQLISRGLYSVAAI